MSRPSPNILLTERDSEILVALTLRIRVLSLEQISRTWWRESKESVAAVRRRLQQLEASGYLEQITLMAHPEVVVEEPICSWEPGQELPDFGNVAWQLNRRWSSPLVATECVIATHFAGQFFGGHGGRKPRRAEMTHDLHLSAVFLQMMSTHPQRAMTWSSEEERKKEAEHGQKLPDAIVTDGDRGTVIEMGGKSYHRKKLEELHQHCAARHLGYEVW